MSEYEDTASVSAELGALSVEVTASSVDEAEETFEAVWERRLKESVEYTEAMKSLRRGFQ